MTTNRHYPIDWDLGYATSSSDDDGSPCVPFTAEGFAHAAAKRAQERTGQPMEVVHESNNGFECWIYRPAVAQ